MADDTKDKGKLLALPGGAKADDYAEAVRAMRKQLADTLEFWKMEAKIRRTYYLALVEEGFTKEEALQLTKGKL